ncbi:1-deoxy-D-xylulose-5-phosphate synthase N-terminal domain-containing protein, partial [Streptomyces sp. SP17BM10]|uniref:1-deoxy-D-xylulose-5-phosphate synthase N-terminal domain-containing protein n=1 Tax=Streptomyces sp. SP17BM10 TaxID=3002530 RepID=UPI002E775A3F
TVLSYADGLAKANQLKGTNDPVVAVSGDGALTGGMAGEAIINSADPKVRAVVIDVAAEERSEEPTRGGMANHLSTLRTTQGYERFLSWGKHALQRTPVVGQQLFETLHGAKKGLKD